ncbi:MAG: HD domain-containing phosphohydrolase [Acidimicrobiales bacterium]
MGTSRAPDDGRQDQGASVNLDEGLLQGADVLVVDDEPANVALVESILERNGFTHIRSTTDPRDFHSLFVDRRPDIILLDLHMPHIGGLDLLRQMDGLLEPEEYLPVLVLSADVTAKARRDALGAGATDFLTKPFDTTEVGLRVLNCLETRRIRLRLDGQRRELDELIRERTASLEESQVGCLTRLQREYADWTDGHTDRVGTTAAALSRSAGLAAELVDRVGKAAPLHDVGNVGVPDSLLRKRGPLDPGERDLVRAHTTIGARIIGETASEVLALAGVIAETHHERWNGEGYPRGLAGEAIPLPGRVVAVCDVFDALTHDRPYARAWTVDRAVRELVTERGRFFDPELVDLFVDQVVPTLPA